MRVPWRGSHDTTRNYGEHQGSILQYGVVCKLILFRLGNFFFRVCTYINPQKIQSELFHALCWILNSTQTWLTPCASFHIFFDLCLPTHPREVIGQVRVMERDCKIASFFICSHQHPLWPLSTQQLYLQF